MTKSGIRLLLSTAPRIASPANGNKEHGRICFCGFTHFARHELPESDTLFTTYPECNGYNHFNAVNVITDSIRLPDVPHCVKFTHFLVLVNRTDCLANVAGEYPEQVGYLLLSHLYGCGRHRDRTRFTDCNDSSIHSTPYFDVVCYCLSFRQPTLFFSVPSACPCLLRFCHRLSVHIPVWFGYWSVPSSWRCSLSGCPPKSEMFRSCGGFDGK